MSPIFKCQTVQEEEDGTNSLSQNVGKK